MINLPARIRCLSDTYLYVSPNGKDCPSNGLTYGQNGDGAFETPGYATAWCNANLDAAGQKVTILIDGNFTYSVNNIPGAVGGIMLYDVLGTVGCWAENPITISGAINGQPITSNVPDSSWPLLSFNGKVAIVGVGCNTVWNIEKLQVQSTSVDIEADRQSKINVKHIVHGNMNTPYPTPIKYAACFGGSIEILDQIWVNSSGTNLWASSQRGEIIGIGPKPILATGITFSSITSKDSTSVVHIPSNWPQ